MPAVPPYFIEPIWELFSALLPETQDALASVVDVHSGVMVLYTPLGAAG